ncbi:hypothetical protein [Microbacterium sp. Leaf203]|uniref:hypothetical protein n=1 Tax=Microbacterium sp. Leaf203 TaxID=1735677 RepID=UPI0006FD57E7|nr:hypothetical protein [Microbacterium sp. Leaf203]KQM36835.1 hypothetical protein ASE56_10495 [Microbacterium sp. Leaf203]
MNGLTLRIDCDPVVIPAAAYEWDVRYRHLIALTVLDCGDHLEIVGEPYTPLKDAEVRWDESWREVFEHSHSNLAWETGITPMKVGETARVASTQRVETPARLAGHEMHVVMSEMVEETVTARHADAWHPGGYFDGFYDPTIELPDAPKPHTPASVTAQYKRGFGETPWDVLDDAIDPGVLAELALGWNRIEHILTGPTGGVMGEHEVLAVVRDVVRFEDESEKKRRSLVKMLEPMTEGAIESLGRDDWRPMTTSELFGLLLGNRSVGAKVAARFKSDPSAFVKWVHANASDLRGAADRLLAEPRKPRRAPVANSIVSFTTSPVTTRFDALPQFRGVAFHGGHTLASQALLAANGGDIRKTLTEMQEEITQTGTNR